MDKELSIKLYQTIAESNERRVYEAWHCSNIGDCPRTHYFKRKGVEPLSKPSAALILRWKAGHLIEEAIREHLEKLFPDIKSNERMYSKTLDLTGEYDNLVDDTIIEIKSVHDGAFIERDGDTYLKEKTGEKTYSTGKTVNTWGPKQDPYLHHELQQHCYVHLLKERGVEVKEIVYIYISLSGRIVVYRTPVKQELLDNVTKRLEVLNKAWADQIAPECLCTAHNHPLYDSVMSYCDFKDPVSGQCCSLELLDEK